ncbi:MAG: biosynthetic arginine decarboxylase, partial [Candidatus Kapabacteria bacterium]|nr:biosynthetic arginine decarboxylase [Candidatus Kapabacteria bacterium]
LTAHHSVLIFNVLESASVPSWDADRNVVNENDHELIKELFDLMNKITVRNVLEQWHDAQHAREQILNMFSLGIIDLQTRAKAERLYWSIAKEVHKIGMDMKHQPEELRSLSKLLADKYFCNFSLFQSLPDSWAIDQLFPILPIHRLDTKPSRVATLQDITCDSDGKIDHFIGERDSSQFLAVHEFTGKESYYLGVFLVGAYQEILGDLHNLFGDTNAVHIICNNDGSYSIDKIIEGETVEDVLDYVQFSGKKLVRTMEAWVSQSVKDKVISVPEAKEFLAIYRSGLYGYTYLEE